MSALEKALNAYFTKFGENFPLCITDCREDAEIIAEIKRCIETDVKAEEPEYEDENEY